MCVHMRCCLARLLGLHRPLAPRPPPRPVPALPQHNSLSPTPVPTPAFKLYIEYSRGLLRDAVAFEKLCLPRRHAA